MMKMEILCAFHPQQILLHFLSFLAHMGVIKYFLSHYRYCSLRHAFWALLPQLPQASLVKLEFVSSVPTGRPSGWLLPEINGIISFS